MVVAIHPGEYLKEILDELDVSQAEFARTLGISAMRVLRVTSGTRPVTAELALPFGKALGQSPDTGSICKTPTTWPRRGAPPGAGLAAFINWSRHRKRFTACGMGGNVEHRKECNSSRDAPSS